jgi:peptidoglycan/LPS O-acetylase OafA/YrhL
MNGTGPATDRNSALDFTKGTLVLFMILYHWINYFVGTQGFVYVYLRFIPPSFIFITGFLIANVYAKKYRFSGPRVYQRLISRGLKILVLFTLLNLIANALFARSYKGAMPGIDGFIRNAASIYMSGNAKASFGVLVPISYLLLLSAVIFLAARIYQHSVHLLCAALFLCLAFMNTYGLSSPNLAFVAIGLLGMVLGYYSIERINRWVDHLYVVVCLNIGYLVAISIWGEEYFLEVVGVCLSVVLIYLIGLKSAACGKFQQPIILLGKYSLFGYIAQIALLQLLQRGLLYLNFHNLALWIISFVGAFALTIITVRVVHQVRAKSHAADWLYRVAFS